MIPKVDDRLHEVARKAEAPEARAGFGRGFGVVDVVNIMQLIAIRTVGVGEAIGVGSAEVFGAPLFFGDAGCRRGECTLSHSEGVEIGGGMNGAGFREGCLGRDHAVFRFRGADRWSSGAVRGRTTGGCPHWALQYEWRVTAKRRDSADRQAPPQVIKPWREVRPRRRPHNGTRTEEGTSKRAL